MSFSEDEEILQDFLVEAGEILEQLSEQLVELEQSPDDKDLLNAIFRGFHTVKGGAGFLQIDAMVECCHVTENLFDILRNGQREVTAHLTDVVLKALDVVNDQFEDIKQQQEPQTAPPELLAELGRLVACEDLNGSDTEAEVEAPAPEVEVEASPEASEATDDGLGFDDEDAPKPGDDITDTEYKELVAAVSQGDTHAGADDNTKASVAASDSDEITEDEFEALLDQLHGEGKGPKVNQKNETKTAKPTAPVTPKVNAGGGGDLITEDEFDDLLDQLHGKGKGPKIEAQSSSPAAPKSSDANKAEKPAPKLEPVAAKPAPKTADKPQAAPAAKKAPTKEAPAPVAETTVRVDTQRLDEIMNMVGELVLVRNRLVRLGDKAADESLSKAVSEETDLDKNLVEALADPLVHLVRNSVDHGIELPDDREQNGKPRQGKVILAAQQEGDHIMLSITDDGGGMDAEKLKKIAVSRGVMDEDAADRAVPVFHLKHWLVRGAANQDKPTDAHIVIVSVGTQRVGFVVDELVGQEEVVIKPLGKMLNGTPGMAGATITGDGTIALILDVPSMLKNYAGNV